MAAGAANGKKRSRTAPSDAIALPTRVGTRRVSPPTHTPPSLASPCLVCSHVSPPPSPRSTDETWDACYALIEELELRGEMTEAEGLVLLKMAEDRHASLGSLFKVSTGLSLGAPSRRASPARALLLLCPALCGGASRAA